MSLSGAAGYVEGTARTRQNDVSYYSRVTRDTMTLAATATQPIYRGGRTVASTRRAENQVLAQRARLLATEQQVLQQAVNAYVNMILYSEELRLNINNVQVLQRQLDRRRAAARQLPAAV